MSRLMGRRARVVVVRLSGAIGVGGRLGRGLSDAATAPLIERAFARRGLAAVALAINSPGGSPTQSELIAGRIRDRAAEKGVPVFAFCEDVAASGGYALACAADEIYAVETSVIGSIGVISAGFGFPRAIEKLGVERRVHTAGDAKARLDPFRPENADDLEWLAALQGDIHETFKGWVRAARGDRLRADAIDRIFSGEVWLGRPALELGLIDGIARLKPKMRELFGDKASLEVVAPRRRLLDRFGGGGLALEEGAAGAAGEIAAQALEALEDRALWARYGR